MRSAFLNLGLNLQSSWARNGKPVESRNYDRLLFAAEHPKMKSADAVPVLKALKVLGGDRITETLEMMSFLPADRGGYSEVSPSIRQLDGKPVLFLGFEGDTAVHIPIDPKDYDLEVGEASLDAVFSFSVEDEGYYAAIPIAKKMKDGESHDAVNAAFVKSPDWANRVRPLPSKFAKAAELKNHKNTEPLAIVEVETSFKEKEGRGFVFATITLEDGTVLTAWNTESTSALFKANQGSLSVLNGEVVGGKEGRVALSDLGSDYNVVHARIRNAKTKEGKSFDLADVVVNHSEIGYTSLSLGLKSTDALTINIKAIMGKLDQITQENPIVVRNSIVSVPESMRPKTPDLDF